MAKTWQAKMRKNRYETLKNPIWQNSLLLSCMPEGGKSVCGLRTHLGTVYTNQQQQKFRKSVKNSAYPGRKVKLSKVLRTPCLPAVFIHSFNLPRKQIWFSSVDLSSFLHELWFYVGLRFR